MKREDFGPSSFYAVSVGVRGILEEGKRGKRGGKRRRGKRGGKGRRGKRVIHGGRREAGRGKAERKEAKR